jgi:hypothetical protein
MISEIKGHVSNPYFVVGKHELMLKWLKDKSCLLDLIEGLLLFILCPLPRDEELVLHRPVYHEHIEGIDAWQLSVVVLKKYNFF